MSYQSLRPRRVSQRGLGQVPTQVGPAQGFQGVPRPGSSVTLPSWNDATYERNINHQSNTFGKVGSEDVLNALIQRLADVKAISPTDRDADSGQFTARRHLRDWMNNQQYEIREDGPFLRALRAFWTRQGRVDNAWPQDTDFGPSTNGSKDLHIAQNFYSALADPHTPLWRVNADGFVRLKNDDMLWNTLVRNALVQAKYLDAHAEVNTKDDGPMVQALKRFYDDGVAAGGTTVGLDYGAWPSGINFGPNTNGDEVRISDKLLTSVLNGWSGRLVDLQKAAAGALAGATIRRPLIGVPAQLQGTTSFTLSPSAIRAALSSPIRSLFITTLKL